MQSRKTAKRKIRYAKLIEQNGVCEQKSWTFLHLFTWFLSFVRIQRRAMSKTLPFDLDFIILISSTISVLFHKRSKYHYLTLISLSMHFDFVFRSLMAIWGWFSWLVLLMLKWPGALMCHSILEQTTKEKNYYNFYLF